MDAVNDLDCRIFIDTAEAPDGVAALLAGVLADAVEGNPTGRTIPTRCGEFDIRRNKEADRDRAREFPDGFLYFRYSLEFYPRPQARPEERVSLAARILNFFWDRGQPAVAVCDYEDALPKGGGYKDRSIPWPSGPADPQESTAHTPNGSPGLRSEGSASAEKPVAMD